MAEDVQALDAEIWRHMQRQARGERPAAAPKTAEPAPEVSAAAAADAELRRRFRLDPARPEERVAIEAPEVAALAARLGELSRRFSLGWDSAMCLRKAREIAADRGAE